MTDRDTKRGHLFFSGPRRSTRIPQELEDLDDMTVGEIDDLMFDDHDDDDTDEEITVAENLPLEPNSIFISRQQTFKDDFIKLPKEARNLIAGGMAGMLAKSVVAPLDRIKILYQVSSAKFYLANVPSVARNIIESEGLSALWKGNTATMIRVFPYSGVQFMVFDRCKSYFLRKQERDHDRADDPGEARGKWGLSPMESLVSGMFAGTLSVLCTYPLDLTRAQLAVLKNHKHAKNRGFVNVLGENYRQRGVVGLFRGITPTLLGILPYSGIAFALNEQGKRKIQNMTGRDVTTIERVQCGAFAGLVAQTLTYPIEVTRRRMQTIGLVGNDTAFSNVGETGATKASLRPPTLTSTVQTLYGEQGVRGFFKGVSMNWMKGPIAFSISFTAFDTIQSMMETEAERAHRLPRRFLSLRREQKE